MNFFARAWKNVSRKITKSILLAVTFFMIGNLVILGLGIGQAAENAKILTRKKMKAVVNYEVDSEKFYNYIQELTDQDEIDKAYNNYPTIDKEIALKLSQDELVKTVNYIRTTMVYSINFENVPLGNEEQKKELFENGEGEIFRDFNIAIHTNIVPTTIEFEEGTNTIVQGRFYTQDEIDTNKPVAVISEELANLNNLKVGDTITYNENQKNGYFSTMIEGSDLTIENFNHDLEIVGIYTTINDVNPSSENFKYMSPYESPKNYIYAPATVISQRSYDDVVKLYNTLKANGKFESVFGSEMIEPSLDDFMAPYKVIYLLDDPLSVDKFVQKYSGTLSEYMKLNANNETFKSLAKPLDTLSFFASIIVWVVTVNAIVIISLVTALTLKTREFEIGVLLSLGVSKFKVILQLFAELILVALIGFSAAILSGSLIAGKVGDEVLKFQQSREEVSETPTWVSTRKDPNDYFTEISQEELFAEYKVTVSPILIAEIYIFGLSVVFVAILIPSAMIMRLNPKQILLSTN